MAKRKAAAEPAADLCIIYDEDAAPWASHFEDTFRNKANTTCFLCSVQTVLPFPKSKVISSNLDSAKAIMIILSTEMMNYLLDHRGCKFTSVIQTTDIGRCIIFYLSVDQVEIDQYAVDKQFPDYFSEKWTKLSYDENSTQEDLQNSITRVLELIETNTPPMVTTTSDLNDVDTTDDPIGEGSIENPDEDDKEDYLPMDKNLYRKPQPAEPQQAESQEQELYLSMQECKLDENVSPEQDAYDVHNFIQEEDEDTYDINSLVPRITTEDSYELTDMQPLVKQQQPVVRKSAAKQISVSAVPSEIPCEHPMEVCLCFQEEIPEGKMDLEICNTDNYSETFEIKTVEKMNPYTFKFTTKGYHTEMKAMIAVYLKDEKIGTCEITFKSGASVTDGVNHILLQVMDVICTTVKESNPEILPKADTQLSKEFMSPETTIEPSAFENLFGIYNCGLDESSKEATPTLLHLAAKYGFKELCAKLIDLPSADLANSICNNEKKVPSEIAKDHKNVELGALLDSFSEMGSDMIYDLYVRMQLYDPNYLLAANKRPQNYYNKSAQVKTDGILYYSSETNSTSRIPTTQEIYSDPIPSEGYMDMKNVKRTLYPQGQPPEPTKPKKDSETCRIADQEIYADADADNRKNHPHKISRQKKGQSLKAKKPWRPSIRRSRSEDVLLGTGPNTREDSTLDYLSYVLAQKDSIRNKAIKGGDVNQQVARQPLDPFHQKSMPRMLRMYFI